MAQVVYIDNDNLLTLSGVLNKSTNLNLNAASCAVTLLTLGGAEVSGETWPLAMSYVSGSSGNYEVVLVDTLVLTKDQEYEAAVIIDDGPGARAEILMPVVALDRRL